MAKDIQHGAFPIGVNGHRAVLNLVFPMMIFKYTKYPNAAKEYLRFMMEREQYVPWQEASIGYVCQPLAAYESSPFWTADAKETPYRDCMKDMRPNSYAGDMGYASAAATGRFHHSEHGRGGGLRGRRRRRKRWSGRSSERSDITRSDGASARRRHPMRAKLTP